MARNIDIVVKVRDESEAALAALEARVRALNDRIRQANSNADPLERARQQAAQQAIIDAQKLETLQARNTEKEKARLREISQLKDELTLRNEAAARREADKTEEQSRRRATRRSETTAREAENDARKEADAVKRVREQVGRDIDKLREQQRKSELASLRTGIQERAKERETDLRAQRAIIEAETNLRRQSVRDQIRELDRLDAAEKRVNQSVARKSDRATFRAPADLRSENAELERIAADRRRLADDIDKSATSLEQSLDRLGRAEGSFSDASSRRTFGGGRETADDARTRSDSIRRERRETDDLTRSQRLLGGITASVVGHLSALGESIRGSSGPLRSFGSLTQFAVVAMAPLVGGLIQLGASLISVAGSAVLAGAALGGAFVAGINQAVPIVAVLAAGITRVISTFNLVKKFRDQQSQDEANAEQAAKRQADLERDRTKLVTDRLQAQRDYSRESGELAQSNAESVVAANERIRDANRGLEEAQRRVVDAQDGLRLSQERLNDAREQATESLRGLTRAEEEADLQRRRAELGVLGAQRNLRLSRASGDILGVQGAQLDLAGARLGAQDARQTAANAAVTRARAERDANRIIEEAQRGVQQAARGVSDAQRGVADASRGVEDATKALTRQEIDNTRAVQDQNRAYQQQLQNFTDRSLALGRQADDLDDATGAVRKLNQEIAKLGPEQRALFESTNRLADTFNKNIQPIIDRLLVPFTVAIDNLVAAFNDPAFLGSLSRLTDAVARSLGDIFKIFTGEQGRSFLISFIDAATNNLPLITRILENLAEAFLRIGQGADPIFRFILEVIDQDITGPLVDFTRNAEDMADFFERSQDSLAQWFSLLGSIFSLLGSLTSVSAGAGNSLVSSFAQFIQDLSDDIQADPDRFRKFFEDAAEATKEFADALVSISKSLNTGGLHDISVFIEEVVAPALEHLMNISADVSDVLTTLFEIPGIGKFLEFAVTLLVLAKAFGIARVAMSLFVATEEGLILANPVGAIFALIGALVLLEIQTGIISSALQTVKGWFEDLIEVFGFISPIASLFDHLSDIYNVIKDIQGLFSGDTSITKLMRDFFSLVIPNILLDALDFVINKVETLVGLLDSIIPGDQGPNPSERVEPGAPDTGELNAAGGFVTATPGGRKVVVGEGGRDEVILTTDGRFAQNTKKNFRKFLAGADPSTKRILLGATDPSTPGAGGAGPRTPGNPGGDPNASGDALGGLVSGPTWIRPWPSAFKFEYGGGPGVGTHSFTQSPNNWESDNAIDIMLPLGTPILSVATGKVHGLHNPDGNYSSRFAGWGVYQDANKQHLWYKHMKQIFVKEGENVPQGHAIGLSGSANSVPHLHFAAQPPFNPTTITGGAGSTGASSIDFTGSYDDGSYKQEGIPGIADIQRRPSLKEQYAKWFSGVFGAQPALDGVLSVGAYNRIAKRLNPLKAKILRMLGIGFEGDGKQPKSATVDGVDIQPGSKGGTPAQNRALGKQMMLDAGLGEGEWNALNQLWTGESGWSQYADNPSSSAYGIPQALTDLHDLPSGYGPPGGSAPTQIGWGLKYIMGRYKTPSAALRFWNSRDPHWYASGTPRLGATGPIIAHRDEMILNPQQQAGVGSFLKRLLDQVGGTGPREGAGQQGSFTLPFNITAPIVKAVGNIIEGLSRQLARAAERGQASKVRTLANRISSIRKNAEERLTELTNSLVTLSDSFTILNNRIQTSATIRDAQSKRRALTTFGEAGINADAADRLNNATAGLGDIRGERVQLQEAQKNLIAERNRKGIGAAAKSRINTALIDIQNRLTTNLTALASAEEEQFNARRGVVDANIGIINNRAAATNAGIQRQQTRAGFGDRSFNTLNQQGGFLNQANGALRTQIDDLVRQLPNLQAIDPDAANDLIQQISDLELQYDQNTDALRANTEEIRSSRISATISASSFFTGVAGGVAGFGRGLGDAGIPLVQAALGAANSNLTGTNNNLLGELFGLTGANLQGQTGATLVRSLLGLAGSEGSFGFNDTQLETFRTLINTILGNATSIQDNTDALNDLNDALTGNGLQTFTSAAWELFRFAVFNGTGGIASTLPLPGGPSSVTNNLTSELNRNVMTGINVNMYGYGEPADPQTIAARIAWEAKSDR